MGVFLARSGWKAGLRRTLPGLLPLLLAGFLAGFLAGCSTVGPGQNQAAAPAPAKPEMSAANQREHLRILAAYGGAYSHPRLEPLLVQTMDKLVSASERPDLKYEITILNSPSVNAFALPTGQLYVTRGLLALANDGSELASVLSHEMAHVIARHAAIREDQARQAALMNRVANDLLSDPQLGALALAKSKITLASFSRAQEFEADGIGVGISARAGYDPFGAQRFLTSMGMNSTLRAKSANIDPRAPDFLSSHPATPERVSNVQSNARQFASPNPDSREKTEYLALIDGLVFGEDPSEGFVRGRRFLHPKLGFTFTAPDGFTLENTAQAVFGVKDGGAQALRLDVVQRADRAGADRLSDLGLDREHQRQERRGGHRQRPSGRDRDGDRRSMDLPPLRRAVRQRGLSLHLRRQEPDRRRRPHVPGFHQFISPDDAVGDQAGQAAYHPGGDGGAGRHGRADGAPHGGHRPACRAVPRAQRHSTRRAAAARRSGQDRC